MGEIQTFGKWLRHHRRELDLTQDELGRRVGCAPITIRKLEGDEMRPSKQLAESIGMQLGISSEQLEDFIKFARSGKLDLVGNDEQLSQFFVQLLKSPSSNSENDGLSNPHISSPAIFSSKTYDQSLHNLPAQITSFIGRVNEIEEIRRLIDSTRLITLIGAGGSGKTRLAIEVAGRVLDQFPDGIWLVDFAPINEVALISQTIASVLKVREDADRPLTQTLIDYLGSKKLLLLMDNCEHLVAACADLVAMLLQTCPQLHILATSREPFAIVGENQYQVPTLTLPLIQTEIVLDNLLKSEAVLVFLDRARMVKPNFKLTTTNAVVVSEICQRLDGIPLGLELAAAHVKKLSVEQIAERLTDRFSLLTSGNRAAMPRQQTLKATLDWSHNLLSAHERIVFARLSVFAGGWTIAAAMAVCLTDSLEGNKVFDLLQNLADKSLIVIEEQQIGETRYRFLETVREYAHERLIESGTDEQVRRAHLSFYIDLAEQGETKYRSKGQLHWYGVMEAERDNFRAALDYALRLDRGEYALRLIGASFWLWFFRGPWSEGEKWAELALAHSSTQLTVAKAKTHLALGMLRFEQSNYSDARIELDRSLSIWRELGDKWWCAFVMDFLARIVHAQDRQTTSDYFQESLSLAQETGEDWILAYSLWNVGENELSLENLPRAHLALGESLRLSLALGDRMLQNEVLRSLGELAEVEQEYMRAVGLYQESLQRVQEFGDTTNISILYYNLGRAYQLAGNDNEAERQFVEAMQWSIRIGKKAGLLRALAGLGVVAESRNEAYRAVCLLSASESLFTQLGISFLFNPHQFAWFERSLISARQRLGENYFSAALAEGQKMALEQAVDYALTGIHAGDSPL